MSDQLEMHIEEKAVHLPDYQRALIADLALFKYTSGLRHFLAHRKFSQYECELLRKQAKENYTVKKSVAAAMETISAA